MSGGGGPRLPTEPVILVAWNHHLLALLPLVARITGPTASLGSPGSPATARTGRTLLFGLDRGGREDRVGDAGIRAAADLTGQPIVPVGVATSAPVSRRSAGDRPLLPPPMARIFVSLGDPIPVSRAPESESPRRHARVAALEPAIEQEVRRCVCAAADASWGHPLTVRTLEDSSSQGARIFSFGSGGIGPLERVVRAAWVAPAPPGWLRLPAALFSAASRTRHAAYDRGVVAIRRAPIRVVSVGGVTVGGSGKTPIAASLAGRLAALGHRPALLTRGYRDEMRLHVMLGAERVWGHPDRVRLVRRAAAEGATVAILDDGFQHRRLARDLDILLLDRDALRRTHRRLLPAGPYREHVPAAVRRADIVIMTGRDPWSDDVAAFDREMRELVASLRPGALIASLSIVDGPLEAGNRRASEPGGGAPPAVAVTGVMKPNLFFEAARRRTGGSVTRELAIPDHGELSTRGRSDLTESAKEGGVVVTRKDLARWDWLRTADFPVWVLPEVILWRSGEAGVWDRVASAVEGARRAGAR